MTSPKRNALIIPNASPPKKRALPATEVIILIPKLFSIDANGVM